MPVAQLIVRNLEESVVALLRRRAAKEGISVEEAHRRLLRETLLGPSGVAARTFKEYLLSMPNAGEDALFARKPSRNREVRL
jgi:plasmid stability protein